MSQQDLTSDMLTRIRNAVRNGASTVTCLNNTLNRGVATVLKDEGFVTRFEVLEDGAQGAIRIELKYGERFEAVINRIDRVFFAVQKRPRIQLIHERFFRTLEDDRPLSEELDTILLMNHTDVPNRSRVLWVSS